MGNNNKNIRPANIDKKRPIIPNEILSNVLLSELSRNFREITFSKFEYLVGIPVLNTRYEHFGS